MTIEGAHTKGTETGSMVFSVDGRTILTRGGDDAVKRKSFMVRSGYLIMILGSLGPSLLQEADSNKIGPCHALSKYQCYVQSG